MDTCPDCTAVKAMAKENPRLQLVDIGQHVRNLKEFLLLRDNNPAFDAVKRKGTIGLPCFVMEDGSIAFSHKGISLPKAEEGSACSIDGKGC